MTASPTTGVDTRNMVVVADARRLHGTTAP
jgi:hypothetical protein